MTCVQDRQFVWRQTVVLAVAAVLAFSARGQAQEKRAAALDKELLEQAPKILDYLRDKGYKNVGVLKFRIKKGKEPVSDNVGTLNMFLANRLEVALVLANSSDQKKQIGIARNASEVAAKIPGASHATAEGREKLFTGSYPLAWGTESITPDAFLTGIAAVTPDLKQMTVGILVFDKTGSALEKAVPPITTPTSAFLMNELGESFVLRGAFDTASVDVVNSKAAETKTVETKVAEAAAEVKLATAKHPLEDPAAPVKLEVLYDGKPVGFEFRDGKAFIPEPQERQKVMFVLKQGSAAPGRFGVVLKVNGENTFNRERLTDFNCKKWILGGQFPQIEVDGFQVDSDVAEEFRVLSQAESKSAEMNYGPDVGTITLAVFKEKGKPPAAPKTDVAKTDLPKTDGAKTDPPKPDTAQKEPAKNDLPPDLPNDEAEDVAALTRGLLPKTPPKNLAALKHQLREAGRKGAETRGLIGQGRLTSSRVQIVKFEPDPTPVMSATIVYYKAK